MQRKCKPTRESVRAAIIIILVKILEKGPLGTNSTALAFNVQGSKHVRIFFNGVGSRASISLAKVVNKRSMSFKEPSQGFFKIIRTKTIKNSYDRYSS